MKTQTRMGLIVALALALFAGLAPRAEAVSASGGNYTNDIPGYRIHVFTNSATASNFVVAVDGGGNVEVLVVAGGGGGGSGNGNIGGGGGGAGGLNYSNVFPVVAGSNYTVTVGAGGTAGSGATSGGQGGLSQFGSILVTGGGSGASYDGTDPSKSGGTGGSGGGGTWKNNGTVATGITGQGTNGGLGSATSTAYGGAGGGGATGIGGNGSGSAGGAGGAGYTSAISGPSVGYAGGGGGGAKTGSAGTATHGGAAGGLNTSGGNASANLGGGGGGGAGTGSTGGAGGSGIVVVRYAVPNAWNYSMPITFTNDARLNTLTNFPALVIFDTNKVNYGQFQANGQDLRFMDGNGAELRYEVESWMSTDSALSNSYIWVQIPTLTAGCSITAYWGNASASLPSYRTNGTAWDSTFKAVWHLDETSGNNEDSTANGLHAAVNGTVSRGVAGAAGSKAIDFGGGYLETAGSLAAFGDAARTVSVWVNPDVTANKNMLGFGAQSSGQMLDFMLHSSGLLGHFYSTDSGVGGSYTTGAWQLCTFTYEGGTAKLYRNGDSPYQKTSLALNTQASTVILGGGKYATYNYLDGKLDEARISSIVRSTNWIYAEYLNMASNTTFNTCGTVSSPAPSTSPQIENRTASGVTTNGATFNGYLAANGGSTATVFVAWGQTNGAVSGSWAATNWWTAGAWTNGSYPSTNLTLEPNANYYYRFGATNSTTNVMATLPQSYQYLITGEVTVQPTDPTGRVGTADTAAFTVYRPTSCTNEALTVAYTLGGTATNGIHYTNSPAATGTNGTVTIAAGQTNAVITVSPVYMIAPEQTVVLSLAAGPYAIGAANSATCTLVAVSASGGTVTNYTLNNTNFTAHIFTNSGTFVTSTNLTVEVLVVAGGGGGGGRYYAGAGGAGGLIYSNAYPVVANSNYTVTVGMGGGGGGGERVKGTNGGDSVFATITATGGGGGGTYDGTDGYGKPGGSGGGASGARSEYGTNSPAGQGNMGGGGGTYGGGGGGGAGSRGLSGTSTNGGAGGTGVVSSISGATNYYAGGGGGGAYTGSRGAGGLGGGGDGADYLGAPSNAVANTGGGGGGANGYNASYVKGGNGGSGIVIVRYVTPTDAPKIENRTPSGVTTNGATYNGYLVDNGASTATVFVAWGQTNGAVSGAWATTNWWAAGAWTNGSYPATNLTLQPNANYYYRFGATNSTKSVVAGGYQYLITGEVTVQATDPTGRVTLTDTAAFTVYRPASCTNEALTVAYTLGGTATNGVHYTNSPAAVVTNGTVTIPAGQTSAVVTVNPFALVVPQQTVVLTLDFGPYAIGAANSATCTLARLSYTWKTASGNWNTAANWNPSGTPGAGDVCTITSNSPCVANANLTGNPQMEVYTNCALDVAADLSSQTIVLDNGGALRKDAATRTVSDPIKIQGAGSVVGRGQQVDFNLNGLIQDGASAGKLVVQWAADGSFQDLIYLRYTNNTYSGGTEVQAGRLYYAATAMLYCDKIYASAPGSLGTGSVLVRSNAWLNLGATNTTGPGAVITVENGGKVEIGANTAGHTILLKDGGKVCKDWSSGTARISTDTIQIEGTGYAVAVMNQTSLSLNGMIRDGATPGRLALDTEPAANNWGVLLYLNGTNTCTGGTEVRPSRHVLGGGWEDWVYAGAAGCFGSGPLIVHPNGWLNLLLATAADWTLTNSISMGAKTSSITNTANIKVQAAAHRLTAAGNVITPGAFTNAASVTTNTTGKLAIDGKFAFARTNGAYATLAIGIADVNGVAGIDYSQLSVSSGDATLAGSITNCDLVVAVATNLMVLPTSATNLVAAGANFSSYQFHSVTWSGAWTGSVQYGNGFIALTGMVQTLGAITLGPVGNVTTNSAQASALLTGISADLYMFWDTQDRGQTFTWAYTNTPLTAFTNTQPLTTITNTATGLAPGTQYSYRFYGTNAALGWPLWSAAGTFTTPALPPEVSVVASDPLGRTNRTDTAAFTVYRPLSATNYAVTVNYTLGGTATNGVDYTNSPAASGTNGTVMIAAGQTSAVVTVYPALQIVTQQTVVLTVAPGDYAIGSANSATCTLAAMDTTIFTWKTPNGNWNTATNWNPSGPPGVISIGRITNNSPCVANTDLTGNPQVEVYTNGILDVAADLSSQTIVLDNGGALRKEGGTSPARMVSDPIKIQGAGYVVGRSRQVDFNLNGRIQDGASAGKLVVQWQADSYWQNAIYLRCTNNTYSGGTEVQAGRLTWPNGDMVWADKFYASAPGSLGTGSVLVRSNAWLNLGATNTTGPGAVITVENGGKVEIGTNTAGHTILLKDGGKVCKDWVSTARTSTDTIQIEGAGYAIGVGQSSFSLNGMIRDGATPGRLVLDTEPAAANWWTHIYLNGTNTCTGGTEVRPTRAGGGYEDWVYVSAAGCFGSGPLVVHPNGWLNLLLGTAADWTLTNNISMGTKISSATNTANIKVQAGAHRLTAAGSVITPGAFTNAASLTTNTTGTLAINGKFAFARNNGNPATLAIGIAGTNGVAGVDYSQLSVGTGDSTLAASITNCDLFVTVAPGLVTDGIVVTNVLASGANFSSYAFHRVAWNGGWTGTVQYGSGTVLLTDIKLTARGTVYLFR